MTLSAGTRISANRRENHGRPSSVPPTVPRNGMLVGETTLRDTQADVPSTERLRAQLAFKDSMVHGILQFTPSIAFCYVLHRCESRDIRCRESFCSTSGGTFLRSPCLGTKELFLLRLFSLAHSAPGVGVVPVSCEGPRSWAAPNRSTKGESGRSAQTRSSMGFDNNSRVILLGRFRQ